MLNHMKSNFLNGDHISWEPSKQLLIVKIEHKVAL